MASLTRTGSAARAERREEVARRLMAVIEASVARGVALSELTVDRLTTEAGMSRSSFYRYFADAGELLRVVGRVGELERTRAGLGIFELEPTATKAEFFTAVRHFVEAGWEHRLVIRLLTDATTLDAGLRDEHEEAVEGAVDFIAAHIRRGQRGGWVRPELHPRTVSRWLVHMADRGLTTIVDPSPEAALPAVADALAVTLWQTLYDGVRDPEGGPCRPR